MKKTGNSKMKKAGTVLAIALLIMLLLRNEKVREIVDKAVRPIFPRGVQVVDDIVKTIVLVCMVILLIAIAAFTGPAWAAMLWITAIILAISGFHSIWFRKKQLNTPQDAVTAAMHKEYALGDLVKPGAVNKAGSANKESRSIWV